MKKFLALCTLFACFATTQLHALVGITIGGALNFNQSDFKKFEQNGSKVNLKNDTTINGAMVFGAAEILLLEVGAYMRNNSTEFKQDGGDTLEFKTDGVGLLFGFGLPLVTPYLTLGTGSTSLEKDGFAFNQDHLDYGLLLRLPFNIVAGTMFSVGKDEEKNGFKYNYSHDSLYIGYSLSIGI